MARFNYTSNITQVSWFNVNPYLTSVVDEQIVEEVAAEWRLPLEASKQERLILRDKKRKRKGDVKWVKWLGIILDENLSLEPHWRARIAKARAFLAKCNGIGNSQWGISPSSWRQLYTASIRAIAMWGAKLGWRGQRDWELEFNRLQYQALRKCTGAVRGARMETVSRIAGVESPSAALEACQGRFMARIMADPGTLGDLMPDEGLGHGDSLAEVLEDEREKWEEESGSGGREGTSGSRMAARTKGEV
ncbi:hypothetical protein EV426DRAFT_707984 [Tirmania nivea]|nr:hypothetical protein EV426DRAFT_707984 [Tirmania nivea]